MKAETKTHHRIRNDSEPLVTLSVGELRQLLQAEIIAALDVCYDGKTGEAAQIIPPYFTVQEAAQLARIAPSTIRLYIRKGQLAANKVGRRVVISKEDLHAFLTSHRATTVN